MTSQEFLSVDAARLRRLTDVAGLFSVAIGVLVLAAWALGIDSLKSIIPGAVTMKPNTALCFLLLGLGLWSATTPGKKPIANGIGRAATVLAILVGALSLWEYLFGVDFAIDQILFRDDPGAVNTQFPGRMSPITAALFLVLGTAVLTRRTRHGPRIAQLAGLSGLFISLVSLVGYAYGVESFMTVLVKTPLAFHTAATFAALSAGVLCLHPSSGVISILTDPSSAGQMARRMLPAAIILPFAVGWLRLWGQNRGFYDTGFGVALMAVSLIGVLTATIVWSAVSTRRIESERVRVQSALRDSEARLAGFLNNAPTVMYIKDTDGKYLLVNREYERLFAVTDQEIRGKTDHDVFPPVLADAFRDNDRRVIANGAAMQMEEVAPHPDGPHTYISHKFPLRDDRGDICAVAGVSTDITARLRAEERFRLAIDAAPSAMVIVNQKGEIVLINALTEAMFGYRKDELVGQPIEILVPDRSRAKHVAQRGEFLAGPKARPMGAGLELFGLHRDRTEFPVEISLSPFTTEDGTFVLAAVVDITERREAEAALRQKTEELERSNRELDDFAYIASHDLKEPLRGIHNYAAFLLEDYGGQLPEDGRAKLETLIRLSQRMETLTDALLTYSRLGRLDLDRQANDLDLVVDEVLDSLRIRLSEEDVTIRRPAGLPTIRCDRVRLGEVFLNLISNAVKYNDKPNKEIEIGRLPHPDRSSPKDGDGAVDAPLVLYVRDNGIGIPEQHLGSIFRIFKRLHARDQYGGGTGAGLTITKKIVERHGGRIWVESAPGVSTTFYFTLQEGGQNDEHDDRRRALDGDRAREPAHSVG